MSPPADIKGRKRESGAARVLGSGTSGIAELLVFHPVDTVAKRLMSNRTNVSFGNLNTIIFKSAAQSPIHQKFLSLFPGLGYAAGYKIAQRVYKFGGQPYFRDLIDKNGGDYFRNTFGKKWGGLMMHATAGSLTGMGEVVLLPLDVLKIKMQTNPDALRGRGFFRLLSEEGIGSLYKGWGWTIARNVPGSFALFGGSAVTKEYLFHLEDYSSATWGQNFVASITGAVASITVASPLDVVKTRIQNANFNSSEGGFAIIREMVKTEGVSAFFKGLTPKILVVGPKLVFSYTLAQSLIPFFGKYV
ncbi:mitochondrial carrier domain-containing protein [Kockovaella imperatae]|uniref:Mitochondrial carrier domain-containing protein n=1 Tax=Kockovaella imperatae TaxID=4999 RepID=A0A1Y1UD61_9TREE|nr:mitochondrial carrier domain-containing protein [Kockovaella imperatae]ORX35464.1 mitochondrial carrier domain-containing protein [Kockovaella imperatae]